MLASVLALPAFAAAKTWVVGVSGNIAPDVGCEASPDECDLWEAINLANSTVGKDTIEFDVPIVEVSDALPDITEAVTIDGSDPAGDPGVEIQMATEEGFFDGIRVTGSGSTIEGLAIGGFPYDGIALVGNENRACGNYLGTRLDGTTEEANQVGIEVAVESEGNKIGATCPAGDGNLISGNEWFGIIDNGAGTEIRRNQIGLDISGKALANGYDPAPSQPGGGIYAWGEGGKIGGIGPGQGNTIAFNEDGGFGGGIVVRSKPNAIRGNSVFANEGAGIEYFLVGAPLEPPQITTVKSTETVSSLVSGTVVGGASETVELDFFANAACEAGGAGEGERYLGSATAETDGAGAAKFEASLPVQPQGTVLTATATATRPLGGGTSEFSTCFTAPQPGPAPPKPPTPPIPDTPIAKVVPSNGESVAVAPKAGVVFVQRPGQKKPTPLKEGQTIPVGSVVDATKGKVTLTSVNAAGEEQTADFYGGKFVVLQHDGSGLVILKLRGGNFSSCGGAKGSAVASGRSGRRLWGSGKGNFRTEGNHGSATVRGTIWFTEDRCASTFFKVKRGVVTIRDFDAGKTFSLPAGKSYLAKP